MLNQEIDHQVKALSEVVDAIARAPDLDSLYGTAMASLRNALGVERASILLFDPDGVMRFKAWLGISDKYRQAMEGHTPWARDTRDPPPLVVPDVDADPGLREHRAVFAAEEIRSLAFIPIVYQEKLLGKFMLYGRTPGSFETETPFATTLGRCIAFAIARHQTEAELRALNQKKEELVQRETEAKLAAEKATKKYSALVDSVEGIVWETDAQIRFTFVSKQTERILGYPLSQWLEDPNFWSSHLHPDDHDWCVQFCMTQTKALLPHKFEYRFLAADGRVVWLRDIVSIVVDANGALAGLRGIMIDISDRKLQEQTRREEAEKNIRLRDDFISIASHELKTPLTAIRLQFQIIQRTLKNLELPGKENLMILFQNSLRQLDQFSKLSDELLDVSRIGAGCLAVNKERVKLSDLVSRTAGHYQADLSLAGCPVSLKLQDNIFGYWDPSRIEQILVNLLSNAMKFGAGKPIEIETKLEGDQAKLVVRDQGIGVAQADHQKIFGRFERVAPTSQYRGLGLGLYIAKQIADAHGGSIQVESELGRGSSFIVTLPLGQGAEMQDRAA